MAKPRKSTALHPAILANKGFLYTDAKLNEAQEEQIRRLAMLASDPEEMAKYPNWSSRYKLVGISSEQGRFLRRTPAYLGALRDAIRLASLEGAAKATSTMVDIATNEEHSQAVAAFGVLGKVGGLVQTAGQVTLTQNNQTINVSLEGRLKELAAAKATRTVDVKVIKEEAP